MGAMDEPKASQARIESTNHHEVISPKIDWRTYMVLFTLSLVYVAQLVNLVGSGSLRGTIASVVGDSQDSIRIVACTVIMITCLSPPMAQVADYLVLGSQMATHCPYLLWTDRLCHSSSSQKSDYVGLISIYAKGFGAP